MSDQAKGHVKSDQNDPRYFETIRHCKAALYYIALARESCPKDYITYKDVRMDISVALECIGMAIEAMGDDGTVPANALNLEN